MKELEQMFEDGSINKFPKKRNHQDGKDIEKNYKMPLVESGTWKVIPRQVLLWIPKKEENAVKEFNKLGIPIVAITDTNCDPDVIDYIIPGNDDAIRAIKLFTSKIADACIEGAARRKELEAEAEKERQEKGEEVVEEKKQKKIWKKNPRGGQ